VDINGVHSATGMAAPAAQQEHLCGARHRDTAAPPRPAGVEEEEEEGVWRRRRRRSSSYSSDTVQTARIWCSCMCVQELF